MVVPGQLSVDLNADVGEGFDDEFHRHIKRSGRRRHDEGAGHRAEHGASGEDRGIDARDIDAERFRHRAILGRRA